MCHIVTAMSAEEMSLSVNGQSQLPPGFRFHPTEEELLHYYLPKKLAYQKIELDVIREIDLNKIEPWDIQDKCKIGSGLQNDWYFFSHKDKKYPTGSRTNRATTVGFWKATGRDKAIYSSIRRIGMRKTLVFYKGRAPQGRKSDWIMHEYRLDDAATSDSMREDGWVICRVFKKKEQRSSSTESSRSSSCNFVDAGVAYQMQYSSSEDRGVLEQILSYMGTTSSSCKQERHDIMWESPSGVDKLLLVEETEHFPKLSDWAALDRLVASQLNGHDETPQSKPIFSYGFGDETMGTQQGHIGKISMQRETTYSTESDLWSFNPSSSSSSSYPISHLSV